MHVLTSDECELETHEECTGKVYCEECAPAPTRPCICPCHLDQQLLPE